MPRRGTRRAEALRRAQEAKSQRDTERAEREALIEAALADYYQAIAETEHIRNTARRKADTIIAAGEQTAADSIAATRDAVRRLRDLLGGNTEVARLCGITTTMVRTYLAAVPETPGTPAAAVTPPEGGDGDAPAAMPNATA